jgi:protein-disulfide isomerase
VSATGPSRGNVKAAITIVEFGDFQCPFCAQAEATLKAVLAKHPDDVRLVFRNYPLGELHPDAQFAAQAGVCADGQGKFWELHDAMFQDQHALGAPALQDAARRIGIDPDRFSHCLSDFATAQAVATDLHAGDAAGVNGTPAFFINGRPLSGNVPAESFEALIADEHNRLARGP